MSWSDRSKQLEHEYAINAWALTLVPEIHDDVLERLTGGMREKLKQWLLSFILPLCPNNKVANESNLVIIDYFWKEFHHFQQQTGPFAKFKGHFSMPDAVNGNFLFGINFIHCLIPKYLVLMLAVPLSNWG